MRLHNRRSPAIAPIATPAAAAATAIATPAARVTTPTPAAKATAALRAFLRLVDAKRTTVERRPVHCLNRLLRLGRCAHGHEAEAS